MLDQNCPVKTELKFSYRNIKLRPRTSRQNMMKFLIQALLIALPVQSWDKNKDQCKIKVDVNATQEALCCQSLGIISNIF